MTCDEAHALLEAYHDAELRPEAHAAVAAHVETCARCKAALAALERLSVAVQSAGQFTAPDRLRENVARLASGGRSRRSLPRFALMAASYLLVAALGGLASYAIVKDGFRHEYEARELASAHARSLVGDRLVQVASSDMHTVRPWFAGKLDFAPEPRDLSAAGFPLLGARTDYIGGQQVAALVYGHDNHVINVFVSPASGRPAAPHVVRGFSVVEWDRGDLRYRAISDLNAATLGALAGKLRAPE